MTKETLPVCFRIYLDKYATVTGEVVAIFPTIPEDRIGVLCSSYHHVGQHCAVNTRNIVRMSKPATKEQYADLLRELQSIGYDNLRIVQKPGAVCYRAMRRQTARQECTK